MVAMITSFVGCQKATTSAPFRPPSTNALAIDPVHGHLLHAQPKLPTVKVWVGGEELVAEIAREPVQIATGMMFRTNMLENEGMIFVFPNAAPRSFYMRNCIVPLSAGYIAPDGTILEIIHMKPHDETGIPSQSDNIRFVLEVPQGWFDRHNIRTGAVVRTEKGPLLQTFFRR
jgi:uncharacterized membrane protein (UPF0127 family)